MKAFGKFELKLMEVKVTVADEIGIYFVGETGERGLALAYNSPKKAISSVKKLKKVLDVEYNIEKDIIERSLREKEEVTETATKHTEKGTKKMNVKRNVNVKQLCRDEVDAGKDMQAVLDTVAAVYVGEGKEEKYAYTRAKAVYADVCKEKGMAKPPRAKKAKKEEVETAPESTSDVQEEATEPETPSSEEIAVQADSDPENEEIEEGEEEVTE